MADSPAVIARRVRRDSIKPVPTSDPVFEAPNVAGISGKALLSFIQRIERVQEEIKALQADVKEIKSEAKGTGFDVKVITHILRIRKQDADDLAEFEAIADTYKRAIGMAP